MSGLGKNHTLSKERETNFCVLEGVEVGSVRMDSVGMDQDRFDLDMSEVI